MALILALGSSELTSEVSNRASFPLLPYSFRVCSIRARLVRLDPFRTAVSFWGQAAQIPSSLSLKRDCSPKIVSSSLHVGRSLCY